MVLAIILCSPLTREYLINYARPLIYTTFMSFPALAAIKAVYTFMAQGRTEKLADDLARLVEMLYSSLRGLKHQSGTSLLIQDLVQIPLHSPRSPIISLLTPDPRGLAQHCQKAGYVVRAIVPPTVPEGSERVRVCLHSGNTSGQVEGFVRLLQQWIHREQHERHDVLEMPTARL